MSIFKRGDVWHIHIQTDHHTIRRSAKTSSRKAAQELHDKIKADLWEQERLGVKPKYTFEQAAVRWLDEKDHKRSIRDDIAKIEYFRIHLAKQTLDSITRDQVVELISGFDTPATKNRYVALLRSIFRRARDVWEWVDRIPAFQTYVEQNSRVSYLTPEQFHALVAELPEAHKGPAILAVSTGLRKSNVYGLRWDHVDLDKRMAWVSPEDAKAGRAIPVPLNDDAFAAIKAQEGKNDIFVFECEPISWKAFQAALKRADLPQEMRFHDLRHTFASWHSMAGTPLHVIQELGGWRSASMLQRYAHLSQGHLIEQAKNINISSKPKLKVAA
jgi:integrase